MPQPSAPATRLLAGRPVHPLGLGCMGMSEFYGPSDEAESLATLQAAADLGVQHFDTADTYGIGHNEELLGRFLRSLPPSRRDTLVVATKFGIVRTPGLYERRIDNTPAYLRSACEASLAADDFRRALPRLQGEAGAANQRLQQALATIAARLEQPVAALALAWLLQRQPHVLPIPGTRRQRHLQQNLAACDLTLPEAVMDELDALFRPGEVQGDRYPQAGWAGIERDA